MRITSELPRGDDLKGPGQETNLILINVLGLTLTIFLVEKLEVILGSGRTGVMRCMQTACR